MKVSIVGTGYVGLPAGAGFAKHGHDVTCVDIDEEKVRRINDGDCPIYEEGLPELLEEMVAAGKLRATTDIDEAVRNTDVTFIAVGTPKRDDGSIDLSYIKQAAEDAAHALGDTDGYHVFVVKSTVVPKTTEEVADIIAEVSGKEPGEEFGVCMNPEFLREGTALNDFLEPDRIVIGELDDRSGDTVAALYQDFDAPILRTSLRAAEMIKYASNSLLATKISFINELGNLCKDLGIDTYEVADGVGLDHRLDRDFLDAGAGFGGSCFPKDVRALIHRGQEEGHDMAILQQVVDVNTRQKTRLVDRLEERIGDLNGTEVAVLGLAFKPGTDDIRESPAIDIIRRLKEKGAAVHAYDPKAEDQMREVHPDVTYHDAYTDALDGVDAALLVTDWPEFNDITLAELKAMNNMLVLEGRRFDYDLPDDVRDGIAWP